jgi:protein TonB
VKRPPAAAAAAEDRLPSVESETLPVQVHNPPPEYPLAARRRRLEGAVVVEVEVLENGRAGEARIVDGDPDSAFAGSALRAVRDWTFQPATRGGRPVRSVERVRFVFKLAGA